MLSKNFAQTFKEPNIQIHLCGDTPACTITCLNLYLEHSTAGSKSVVTHCNPGQCKNIGGRHGPSATPQYRQVGTCWKALLELYVRLHRRQSHGGLPSHSRKLAAQRCKLTVQPCSSKTHSVTPAHGLGAAQISLHRFVIITAREQITWQGYQVDSMRVVRSCTWGTESHPKVCLSCPR